MNEYIFRVVMIVSNVEKVKGARIRVIGPSL